MVQGGGSKHVRKSYVCAKSRLPGLPPPPLLFVVDSFFSHKCKCFFRFCSPCLSRIQVSSCSPPVTSRSSEAAAERENTCLHENVTCSARCEEWRPPDEITYFFLSFVVALHTITVIVTTYSKSPKSQTRDLKIYSHQPASERSFLIFDFSINAPAPPPPYNFMHRCTAPRNFGECKAPVLSQRSAVCVGLVFVVNSVRRFNRLFLYF